MEARAETTAPRGVDAALWVLQVVLAVVFFVVGWPKATQPLTDLAGPLPWVAEVPAALVRVVGVLEVLGAVGLVLPAATRIAPRLTGWSAAGLAGGMVVAIGFRLVRGEPGQLSAPMILAVLCTLLALGRLFAAPIRPRQRFDAGDRAFPRGRQ